MLDYATEQILISDKRYKEYFEEYYKEFIEIHYTEDEKFYGYTEEEIEWEKSRKNFVFSQIFDLPDNLLDRPNNFYDSVSIKLFYNYISTIHILNNIDWYKNNTEIPYSYDFLSTCLHSFFLNKVESELRIIQWDTYNTLGGKNVLINENYGHYIPRKDVDLYFQALIDWLVENNEIKVSFEYK